MRPARRRIAGAVAALAAVPLLISSCILSTDEAACLAKLNMLLPTDLIYVGGTLILAAEWDGDAAGCPQDFEWSATGPVQLLQTTGASIEALATGIGDADFTVAAGSYTVTQRLEFLRLTSDINVGYSGLPAGLSGHVEVTGPGGFQEIVTTPRTIADVDAGTYSYQAFDVTGGPIGHRYGGGSGTFQVGQNVSFHLDIAYERRTAQLDFSAEGLLPGTAVSQYGTLVNGVTHDITQSPQSFALENGDYTYELNTVDPDGFRYRPETTTGTLNVEAPNVYQIVTYYAASRGRVDFIFDGLPPGASVPVQLTGPWTINGMGPGSIFAKPGDYLVNVQPFMYTNVATNRIETYTPAQTSVPIVVVLGTILQSQQYWQLTAALATYLSVIGVVSDPWGHAAFIAMAAALNLVLRIDYPAPPPPGPAGAAAAAAVQGTITISGPAPWVTVSGPLQDDGSFVATGTGTVAGFPNVPVTFTGTLSADGTTVSGILQMGQDAAPTGLPNGAIRYSIEGTRATVNP